ncbi:MAG: glycosyltransferase family 4 protein [Candidatus Omnitrophica bacterium]|nr:glycosyltransferase family 4 protein [Candidatus Omnitrophota bacterium]
MKILLINKYLYPKGGDAISTLNTGRLLTKMGHEVIYWGMDHPDNPEYPNKESFVPNINYAANVSLFKKIIIANNILYSYDAKSRVEGIIKTEKPDIVHVNNIAHQISPSILHVFKKYRIPTVMTLRDFKLVCPVYTMTNRGVICEKCKRGRYYNCLMKKCSKDSYIKSAINMFEMYLHHCIMHIYDDIQTVIATSIFIKDKHIEMGLKNNIVHLPNFVHVNDYSPVYKWEDEFIVYFGRLSKEKGIDTLIEAVKGIPIKLKIIGDGPMRKELEELSKDYKNIVFIGHKYGNDLRNEIAKSMFTVIPSNWYEAFGRTVIESYALGKPVIGSKIGGIPELIKEYRTGLTFKAGDVVDLRNKINYLLGNPERITSYGKEGRIYVENEFNELKHYKRLIEIYNSAIADYRNKIN